MDLAQAFFLLKSLKEHIPNSSSVDQKWVDDFHSLLDAVEKETGNDLNAFRVGESELFHPVISFNRSSRRGAGTVRRSERTVVEHARLLHKLDAVLAYFQYTQGGGDAPKPSVGFRK